MGRKSSGTRGDVRQSALWGSGNRGGEHRSSALWGKGGRGIATTVLALALALPLAASAEPGKGSSGSNASYVSSGLKNKMKSNPNELVNVIVMSNAGAADAEKATKLLGKLQKRLGLIDGVAVELRAKEIEKLEKMSGLTITENAPLRAQAVGSTSNQLWPHENGVNKLWDGPKAPAIAIVDSGVDAARADFGGRVTFQKSFVSSGLNSLGDGRGHGTFVAGVAAGGAAGFAGASPNSDIVSLDVLSDNGSGLTSDVIAAAEWIHLNYKQYNIRVANFSLHSGGTANFYNDPLDRAVEKLWFDGIVVVAAVGNYGNANGPSGVKYAPGNDPFVISVGAADIGGSSNVKDDKQAPWSAYGYTRDGFAKPEICAAGRYMIGPVPMTSTLAKERADKLQKQLGYIELSGTSFAAPVVAGVAAQLLARSPGLTPDQVKGTLMRRARPVPDAAPGACGVGQINAVKTGFDPSGTANPNAGLNRFVVSASNGSGKTFDSVSWNEAAKATASGAVSWNEVSWNEVSWNEAAWDVVSWNEVSWNEVSWNEVSWNEVSWNESSQEDAAEGDPLEVDGYELTQAEAAAAASDPDLMGPAEAGLQTATDLLTSTLP